MIQNKLHTQHDYFIKYQKSLEKIRCLKAERQVSDQVYVALMSENERLKNSINQIVNAVVESGAI